MEVSETKQLHITMTPDEAESIALCIYRDMLRQAAFTALEKSDFVKQVSSRVGYMKILYDFARGKSISNKKSGDIYAAFDENLKKRKK